MTDSIPFSSSHFSVSSATADGAALPTDPAVASSHAEVRARLCEPVAQTAGSEPHASCLALLQQSQAAQTDALVVLLTLKAAWSDVFSESLQRHLNGAIDGLLCSAQQNHRLLQAVTLTEVASASALEPASAQAKLPVTAGERS